MEFNAAKKRPDTQRLAGWETFRASKRFVRRSQKKIMKWARSSTQQCWDAPLGYAAARFAKEAPEGKSQ
jgi:hypothetical protein